MTSKRENPLLLRILSDSGSSGDGVDSDLMGRIDFIRRKFFYPDGSSAGVPSWKEVDGEFSPINGFFIAGDMRHCVSRGQGPGRGEAIFPLLGGDPVFPGLSIAVEGKYGFAGDRFAPRESQSRVDFSCFRL
jgi:hypothetical protein